MTDPYKVLGIPPTATDDEIKKAYRDLARKYHPDKYRDSDLADIASEKMKEINAAYEEIQNIRKNGGTSQQSNGGYRYGNGNYGQQHSQSNTKYAHIRRLISSGNLDTAEQALLAVHEGDRIAEWHFLYGTVLLRKNQHIDAQKHFDTACAMDPYNREYRAVRDNLRRRAGNYGSTQSTADARIGCLPLCLSLLCVSCCCRSRR